MDDLILFNPITQTILRSIVNVRIQELSKRLLEDKELILFMDENGKDWLSEHSWNPSFGARPLNRLIQKRIVTPLAELLLDGGVLIGDPVHVQVVGDDLIVLRNHKAET